MTRHLALAALFALSARPCPAESPDTAVSAATERRLARVEARASESLVARRVFAAARRAPRREIVDLDRPDPMDVRVRAEPEILIDSERLAALDDAELEILLVLNCSRAAIGGQAPLLEAEEAAWQTALRFAVERGAEDPSGFGARLAKAAEKSHPGPLVRLPAGPFDRAGLLLKLFERDPQEFYRAIEEASIWSEGFLRLVEIEDLHALRADEIASLREAPRGRYAVLGGRRYPAGLVAAAFALRGTGETQRLRGALESYDTVGAAALRTGLQRWRSAVGR